MAIHEHLDHRNLHKGAQAAIDFFADQGQELTSAQQRIMIHAFDCGVSTLQSKPLDTLAPKKLL